MIVSSILLNGFSLELFQSAIGFLWLAYLVALLDIFLTLVVCQKLERWMGINGLRNMADRRRAS